MKVKGLGLGGDPRARVGRGSPLLGLDPLGFNGLPWAWIRFGGDTVAALDPPSA